MILPQELVKYLQLAYSAEKAAAFAYQGHAASVKSPEEKRAIREIENDEWVHRAEVAKLMKIYNVKPSRYYEIRFWIIGKLISTSCYIIGWFMPMYFAGRLESGNVCEYYAMKKIFHKLNMHQHDEILTEMELKEKEHEIFFLEQIRGHRLTPFFESVFGWGPNKSFNKHELNSNAQPETAIAEP